MFLNRNKEIATGRHHLPHWQQGSVWVSLTFHLGDSLPAARLARWKNERAVWLRQHPEPWDDATEASYHQQFSRRIERWLDAGSGSCLLRDPATAGVVAEALLHFQPQRYLIECFVVMPNHVHVLFSPAAGQSIGGIAKSWKGFTARAINRRLGRTGPLWHGDYFDRLIRSEEHFERSIRYIRENPAKLPPGEFILWP